jgi:hypothetical protein
MMSGGPRFSVHATRASITQCSHDLFENVAWVDAERADGSTIRLTIYLPPGKEVEIFRFHGAEELERINEMAMAADMMKGVPA